MVNHPNRKQEDDRNRSDPIQEITSKDVANLPAVTGTALDVVDFDYGDGGVSGFENTRLEEQSTPWLSIAQGLSPELNRGKGEYIPGLELGMIFNTALREPIPGDPGLSVIVCWKHYHYGLWIPRALGGGFRGALEPDHPLVGQTINRVSEKYGKSNARFKMPRYNAETGRWTDEPPRSPTTDEDVEMVETGNLYVMYTPLPERIDEMNAKYALIRFTSTKLGPYNDYVSRHLHKKWTQLTGPPREARAYSYYWKLSTWLDKRKKGEFYNWSFELDNAAGAADKYYGALVKTTSRLYELAAEFSQQAKDNLVKPDYEATATEVVDNYAPPF